MEKGACVLVGIVIIDVGLDQHFKRAINSSLSFELLLVSTEQILLEAWAEQVYHSIREEIQLPVPVAHLCRQGERIRTPLTPSHIPGRCRYLFPVPFINRSDSAFVNKPRHFVN